MQKSRERITYFLNTNFSNQKYDNAWKTTFSTLAHTNYVMFKLGGNMEDQDDCPYMEFLLFDHTNNLYYLNNNQYYVTWGRGIVQNYIVQLKPNTNYSFFCSTWCDALSSLLEMCKAIDVFDDEIIISNNIAYLSGEASSLLDYSISGPNNEDWGTHNYGSCYYKPYIDWTTGDYDEVVKEYNYGDI